MSTGKVLPSYLETPWGFPIFPNVSLDAMATALKYEPREDDLFIATYPKCGTTWVQTVVACIFRRGRPFETAAQFFADTPYLDVAGAEAVVRMKRPGAIKTHLPFHLVPWSHEAKYIFVARNPKDCCVSFFHHTRNLPMYDFKEGRFDDFFELFMSGRVDYGDYFDVLLSWYEHRYERNVLFLTYEDLKRDTRSNVLRIADFIGPQYKEELLAEEGRVLEDVIQHSSFSFMQARLNRQVAELAAMPRDRILNHPDLPEGMKQLLTSEKKLFDGGSDSVSYCRKGIVGDWKSYFSPDQNKRLQDKFKERTTGTDIPKLWQDVM